MSTATFLPAARAEFEEAIAYLDSEADGLGERLISEVERGAKTIELYPNIGERVSTHVRRYVLRSLPYHIFYVSGPDGPLIVAVAHQRRRPSYWRNRVRKLSR